MIDWLWAAHDLVITLNFYWLFEPLATFTLLTIFALLGYPLGMLLAGVLSEATLERIPWGQRLKLKLPWQAKREVWKRPPHSSGLEHLISHALEAYLEDDEDEVLVTLRLSQMICQFYHYDLLAMELHARYHHYRRMIADD